MGIQERRKSDSVIFLCHMLEVHHSMRIIQDMEMGAAMKNAILGKNVDKTVFGSDLAKFKQET